MGQNGTTRRLAAILAADVVGYSRLIGADEAGTLVALRAILDWIVKPTLDAHNGRLVKLMGDGVLAEIASVIDAVKGAVAIQTAMAEREKPNPENARIRFRIGINLGDIIIEDEDIFGDGVILAARLEGLADPGGICVSRTVADHVGVKAGVVFEVLGKQQIKNIADPVEAFRVVKAGTAPVKKSRINRRLVAAVMALLIVAAGGIWWMAQPDFTPADPAKMATPLPAGPSIAVLPFSYLGPDKEANNYISDDLSENIISTLARPPPGTEAFWYAGAAQAQLALGNNSEAQIAIAKAFEFDPDLAIRTLSLWDVPYVNPSFPEKRYVRLRQLGVPESP